MPTTSANAESARAGLMTDGHPIPLDGVVVDAKVNDVAARVTMTQRYRNRESKPIEAVYVFPLDEMASVCGFDAVVNGRVFTGHVKPRDEAFKAYDDALAGGHGSYLLDEERPDVFAASVGNIPPGAEVLLRITYVAELTLEGDALRFTLPTTVSPRYAPAEDRTGVGRPPSDALNPPLMWEVPYGLEFSMRIEMPGAITRVESPSHPISVSLGGAGATVTLSQASTALDRDVVVLIEAENVHAPHVHIERHEDGHLAAAVVARPFFETTARGAEVVFVVDRSGSMEGSSIAEVRNALQLCLRSLPAGSWFNIIGFGSDFQSLFEASRPYDQSSLEIASHHVAGLKADLGGTEILPALTFALERPRVSGMARQLVVLTDGDVTNPDNVMALVAGHAANTRLFAFGIGSGASAYFVRGMARAGRGVAEFILPGSRIEPAVVRQFGRLLAPAVTDIAITWGDLEVTPALSQTPAVFAGSRLVSYAFIKSSKEFHPTTVTISGRMGERAFSVSAPINDGAAEPGRLIGPLAARARIRELEELPAGLVHRGSRQTGRTAERMTAEIIELSTRYDVISRETSFVVMEPREGATPTEMNLRKVPVALRAGWGGIQPVRITTVSRGPMAAGLEDGDAMPMALSAPPPGAPGMISAEFAREFSMPGFLRAPAKTIKRNWSRLSRASGAGGRPPAIEHTDEPPSVRPPFDHLISFQDADGSWDLTHAVAAGLSIELRLLEKWMPPVPGLNAQRRVWATMLVIAWLRHFAADHDNEWQLLVQKAEEWLAAQGHAAVLDAYRREAMRITTS